MKASVIGLVWVHALGISSLAAAQAPAADEVVARLGSTEVRASEVRRLVEGRPPEVRRELLQSPELLGRLARTEVYRRALLAEAKAKGWDKRPEFVEQLERAREQLLVASYMNDVSRPPAGYPSEQELNEFYRANQAEFSVAKQLRLSQLYVSAEKDAEGAKRKAEELARKARDKAADFAALARVNSEHKPSADQGGDMGWIPEDGLVPEIRSAVASTGKGEIVGPIRSSEGWHIVKLVDTKPPSVRPLSEVRDGLVVALRQRKAQESERRYLDDLAARLNLSVDEAALARLRAQADTESKPR